MWASGSSQHATVQRQLGRIHTGVNLITRAGHIGDPEDSIFRYFDFSNLREIVFRAKGTPGTIDIEINTFLTQTSGQDWNRFMYSIELTDQWQQFVVPVDSLLMRRGEPLFTWEEAGKKVDAINFNRPTEQTDTFPQNITIQLDDVFLVGLTVDQVMVEY